LSIRTDSRARLRLDGQPLQALLGGLQGSGDRDALLDLNCHRYRVAPGPRPELASGPAQRIKAQPLPLHPGARIGAAEVRRNFLGRDRDQFIGQGVGSKFASFAVFSL
jgi:hypothetical protein